MSENIVNGVVTGIHIGTPMQDATPDNPTDNDAYYIERATKTRANNYEDNLNVDYYADTILESAKSTNGIGWSEIASVTLINNRSFETSYDSEFGCYCSSEFNIDHAIYKGEELTVHFNRKKYVCMVKSSEGWGGNYVGNLSILDNAQENTGEPFLCRIYNDDKTLYVYTTTGGEYNITISCKKEIIHKINSKYSSADIAISIGDNSLVSPLNLNNVSIKSGSALNVIKAFQQQRQPTIDLETIWGRCTISKVYLEGDVICIKAYIVSHDDDYVYIVHYTLYLNEDGTFSSGEKVYSKLTLTFT